MFILICVEIESEVFSMRENIIISGGVGGIGREIASKFVKEGYFTYLVDIDDEEAQKVVDEIGNVNCKYLKLNVTDVVAIENLCKTFSDDFCVKHIITLAGRAHKEEWAGFEGQSVESIRDSVDLNLTGHLNIIKAFLPFLKRTKGDKSVLMISSINSFGGFGLPVYSAAKAGLHGFASAVADEFGKFSARINTLSLGTVVTESTKKEPKNFEKLLEHTALGKFVKTSDVAETAYHMCNTMTGITGENLILDAGQTKTHIY